MGRDGAAKRSDPELCAEVADLLYIQDYEEQPLNVTVLRGVRNG